MALVAWGGGIVLFSLPHYTTRRRYCQIAELGALLAYDVLPDFKDRGLALEPSGMISVVNKDPLNP